MRDRDAAVGGIIGFSASWSAVSDTSGGRDYYRPESVVTVSVAAALGTEALLDSTPSALGSAGASAAD